MSVVIVGQIKWVGYTSSYEKKDAVKFGRHIGTTELDVKFFFFKSFSGENNIYIYLFLMLFPFKNALSIFFIIFFLFTY